MFVPKVSAVIPCFNTRHCVVSAVESALAQDDCPVEAVIVDDGSVDGTADVIDLAFGTDERVQLIRLPTNQGPSAARNAGFQASRGEWIGLLDSDDTWKPNRIKTLLKHQKEADFIADNLLAYDVKAGVTTGPVYEGLSDKKLTFMDFILPSSSDRHDFGYLQPIIRRKFMEEHKIRYREDVRAGEDLLLNLRTLAAGARALYVNEPLYVYATPVGAISRSASPHSRSTADTAPLIRALEELYCEVGSKLSSSEKKAFDMRLTDLRQQAPIGAFHRAKAKGHYLKMLSLILGEAAVRRRIYERIIGAPPNRSSGFRSEKITSDS